MRGVGLLVLVGVLVAGCSSGGQPSSSAAGSASPAVGTTGSPSAGPLDSAGSGSPGPGPATASPPLSSTDLPTIDPTGPPKRPSDNFKPIVASGRVRVA